MKRDLPLLGPLVLALAVAHGVFTWTHRDIRPVLDVLTPPPGPLATKVAAAGDNQFLYRFWELDLQNAGDTGGRATPMRDYDYDLVLRWLQTLQSLDPRSQAYDFLASNYFSQTPKLDDIRRVIAFVVDDVARDPAEKWVWLVRGAETAETRLKDTAYALELWQRLIAYDLPEMNFNAVTIPAILLEKLGRYAEARAAINQVLQKRAGTLSPDEQSWADSFIQGLPRD